MHGLRIGRVERLIDALKLARVSGIPIDKLAGDAFDPESIPAAQPSGEIWPRKGPRIVGNQ
jgi:hypothetical protein